MTPLAGRKDLAVLPVIEAIARQARAKAAAPSDQAERTHAEQDGAQRSHRPARRVAP